MRAEPIHDCQCPRCQQGPPNFTQRMHAHINLLLSTLDEHQRRLYVGLESEKIGHGGDRHLAQITGMSVHTIAKGRQELQDFHTGLQVRPTECHKPRVEKKRPGDSARSRTTAGRGYCR